MIAAARKAGRGLSRDFGEVAELQVSRKGPGDFVTKADIRAEDVLFAELTKARPGYGFLGEERGFIEGTDRTHRWIVDPIDGTTNFMHAIAHFAISIALEREGQLIAGVIYNPVTNDLYLAEKGRGAFQNDRRLRVAARSSMEEAIFATGIPFMNRPDTAQSLKDIAQVTTRSAGIRRFGAASLDLAFVAAGRFDGFWERNLKPWDIAAGALLVREAGGFCTEIDGGDFMQTGSIAAANEALLPKLVERLKPV